MIQDEFNIVEADNVDNVGDIEKAVDDVVDTLKEEANKVKNETVVTVGNTDKTQDKTTTYNTGKTATTDNGNTKTISSGTTKMEPMLWTAYHLREIMEFKSKCRYLFGDNISKRVS